MRALGDRRANNGENNEKRPRVGCNPGPTHLPEPENNQQDNTPSSFEEDIDLTV